MRGMLKSIMGMKFSPESISSENIFLESISPENVSSGNISPEIVSSKFSSEPQTHLVPEGGISLISDVDVSKVSYIGCSLLSHIRYVRTISSNYRNKRFFSNTWDSDPEDSTSFATVAGSVSRSRPGGAWVSQLCILTF